MATSAALHGGVLSLKAESSRGISLFGPWIDGLALGGLSIAVYLGFLASGYTAQSPSLLQLVLLGSFVVNYPHYAATYFKAYRTRAEISAYFGVCVIVPLILLGLGLTSLLAPLAVAPWFCKAYLLTSGYHYSGQTYGIALIFANKARMPLHGWQKLFLMAPIYLAYLYLLAQKEEAKAAPEPFYTMQIQPIGFPSEVTTALNLLFALGLLFYVALNGYWFIKHGKLFPMIVHVVVASHVVWFVFGARNPAFYYFVPFFHCLQYLVITTYFYFKKTRADASAPVSSAMPSRTGSFLSYYVGLVVLGAFLFQVPPLMLSWSGCVDFYLASAVVMALVNLHHFIMDGAIWKLRKPEVGKVLIQPNPVV
jgi:hypothetical protein